MRKLALLTSAAYLLFCLAGRAEDEQEVRAVIAKAIKAHGGKKALEKVRISQSKGKGIIEVMGMTVPFTADTTVELPDKTRVAMEVELNNMKIPLVTVINGDKGWVNILGQTKELDKETMAQSREEMHAAQVGNLLVLKDKGYKLSALGEAKVEGKQAVGVQVSSKGYRDVNLYFDKASGLLVKMEFRGPEPVSKQEVTQERIISDYKDIDGVKTPSKVLIKHDGKRFMEAEVSEVQFPSQVDASTFAKP